MKTKILIIDNESENISAAYSQFSKVEGVELTVIRSCEEFDKAFRPHLWSKAWPIVEVEPNPIAQYDVVLTALSLPLNHYEMRAHTDEHTGFPFGVHIAAFAKQAGVKMVGVVESTFQGEYYNWPSEFFPICYLRRLDGPNERNHDEMSGKLGMVMPIFGAYVVRWLDSKRPTGRKGEYKNPDREESYLTKEEEKGWILAYEYLTKNR